MDAARLSSLKTQAEAPKRKEVNITPQRSTQSPVTDP